MKSRLWLWHRPATHSVKAFFKWSLKEKLTFTHTSEAVHGGAAFTEHKICTDGWRVLTRRAEADVSLAQIAGRTQPWTLWHAANFNGRLHFGETNYCQEKEAGERARSSGQVPFQSSVDVSALEAVNDTSGYIQMFKREFWENRQMFPAVGRPEQFPSGEQVMFLQRITFTSYQCVVGSQTVSSVIVGDQNRDFKPTCGVF